MASGNGVLLALAVSAAIVGCGDDPLPGCDPDVTCPATTSGAGTSEGGSTIDPDASADGSTLATDPTATSEGESEGSSAGESADSGESDASTGAPNEAEYRAIAIVGGLDRIRIFKHDLVTDHCTWITLVFPGSPGQYDVTAPEGWSVEQVAISDDGRACESDSPDMFGSEAATAATGTIEFGEPGVVYPCLVSPAVDAAFAGRLPGIPPTDTLAATDIPVEGC